MSAIVVRRYVGGYEGRQRYSIRRRPDGSFQIFHDNPYESVNQPYQWDDAAVSGLFTDFETAEAEWFRDPKISIQISR